MKTLNLCPACLTELPDDYPYDHVAIDLALGSQPELFGRMTEQERTETLRTGLARNMTLTQLGERFHRNSLQIRALLPESEQPMLVDHREELLRQIRALWEQDFTDVQIGLRLSRAPGTVNKLRRRMKLSSKFGPGGRRIKAVPA